jgi:hypothetical protein
LKKTATDFGFLGVSLVSEEEEEEEEEELLSVEWSDKEFFSQILSTIAVSLPFLLQFLLFASLSFPPSPCDRRKCAFCLRIIRIR